MYDRNNIFAKILRKEIPCEIIFENEFAIAFNDIHPQAPAHILIIPKGEYTSFDDFVLTASSDFISGFFKSVREIAHLLQLAEGGYRIITNHGNNAMQTVKHFHIHLLGKKKLGALVVGDSYHAQNLV